MVRVYRGFFYGNFNSWFSQIGPEGQNIGFTTFFCDAGHFYKISLQIPIFPEDTTTVCFYAYFNILFRWLLWSIATQWSQQPCGKAVTHFPWEILQSQLNSINPWRLPTVFLLQTILLDTKIQLELLLWQKADKRYIHVIHNVFKIQKSSCTHTYRKQIYD